jgi:hypothetical protein
MAKKRKRRRPERSILHLTLEREPFDQIAAGTKTTEWRRNSEYWRSRLLNRTYDEIHFRNGYHRLAPFMRVRCLGVRKASTREFAIRLGKVLEKKHYRKREQ